MLVYRSGVCPLILNHKHSKGCDLLEGNVQHIQAAPLQRVQPFLLTSQPILSRVLISIYHNPPNMEALSSYFCNSNRIKAMHLLILSVLFPMMYVLVFRELRWDLAVLLSQECTSAPISCQAIIIPRIPRRGEIEMGS